jgi:hypothetical protein
MLKICRIYCFPTAKWLGERASILRLKVRCLCCFASYKINRRKLKSVLCYEVIKTIMNSSVLVWGKLNFFLLHGMEMLGITKPLVLNFDCTGRGRGFFRTISQHPLSRRLGGPQYRPGYFGKKVRVAVEGDLTTIPQTFSRFLDIKLPACGGS